MREILFRGKTEDGEWVYGSPIFQDGYVLIRFWNSEEFEFEEYLVIPETISEFTSLTDKNGKKIFEGDIVVDVGCSPEYQSPRVVCYGTGTFDSGVYKYTGFVAMLPDGDAECGEMTSAYVDKDNCPIGWEIIGNIHDNPELLKGE